MSIIEKALLKRSKDSPVAPRGSPADAGEYGPGQGDPGQTPVRFKRTAREPLVGSNRVDRQIHAVQKILKARGILVPEALDIPLADEYRRIKKPLLGNAFGKGSELISHANLMMVTSALPGEGKTYTALNLAVSMALEREKTVLLVDCDVIKQDLSCILELADAPGLVDVLEEDVDLGDALVHTDVPDLVLLTAGAKHEYITEALSSDRMSALVHEMATRYPDRVILFDSSPLLATPQSAILAGLVGQAVMVVDAGHTPRSSVEDALALLDENLVVGLVLNKAGRSRKRYSSAYYYGGSSGRPT